MFAYKKIATIQVDVDSLWAIAENAGIPFSGSNQIIYKLAIPRFLKLFKKFNLKATFFVIGKDVLNSENKEILQEIVREGHEIANHTLRHVSDRPFLSLSTDEIIHEIKISHDAIKRVIEIEPVGFKTPAYSPISETIIEILKEMKYEYDSSLMPVSIPYLLNVAQFLFGKKTGYSFWADSRIRKNKGRIKQVPVSNMPILGLPFNSTFVFLLGNRWFRLGYLLKREENVLNYLFHAVDLIGKDELGTELSGLLGINYPIDYKEKICSYIVSRIKRDYELMPTKELIKYL